MDCSVRLVGGGEPLMSVAFLLTSLVIVATPGTGALFTIAAGLSRGARASLVAAADVAGGVLLRGA